MAEEIRKNRKPVASDNPFIAIQENVSKQIVAALDGWRDFTEAVAEKTFLTVYGSPALPGGGRDRSLRCAAHAKAGQKSTLSRATAKADRRA